jgi:hypothetical protein
MKTLSDSKIQDLLLKLEGFKYAMMLDLNMGYYHIKLSPSSKCLCSINAFWQIQIPAFTYGSIFQEHMY